MLLLRLLLAGMRRAARQQAAREHGLALALRPLRDLLLPLLLALALTCPLPLLALPLGGIPIFLPVPCRITTTLRPILAPNATLWWLEHRLAGVHAVGCDAGETKLCRQRHDLCSLGMGAVQRDHLPLVAHDLGQQRGLAACSVTEVGEVG